MQFKHSSTIRRRTQRCHSNKSVNCLFDILVNRFAFNNHSVLYHSQDIMVDYSKWKDIEVRTKPPDCMHYNIHKEYIYTYSVIRSI